MKWYILSFIFQMRWPGGHWPLPSSPPLPSPLCSRRLSQVRWLRLIWLAFKYFNWSESIHPTAVVGVDEIFGGIWWTLVIDFSNSSKQASAFKSSKMSQRRARSFFRWGTRRANYSSKWYDWNGTRASIIAEAIWWFAAFVPQRNCTFQIPLV